MFALYVFFLKKAFVDVPGTKWSVVASNSQTQYAPVGSPNPDVWTDTRDLDGLGTQWCLIQRTSGEQVLISGGNGSLQTVKISVSGGFSGGDSSNIPSASDEINAIRYIDSRFLEVSSIHVFWKTDGTSHRIFIKDNHLSFGILLCEKASPEPGSEILNEMVFASVSSFGDTDPLTSNYVNSYATEYLLSFPRAFYVTRRNGGTEVLPLISELTVNSNVRQNTIYGDSSSIYNSKIAPYSYEESKYGILFVEPIRLAYESGAKSQPVGKLADCFFANSKIARNNKIKINKGISDEYYYFFGPFGQLVDANLDLGER